MAQRGYVVKIELPSRSSEIVEHCPPITRLLDEGGRIIEMLHLATDEYHATVLVLVEEP